MAKRYFEYKDAKSHKFWEVSVSGKKVNIRYGKLGTDGQTSVKELGTPAEAKAHAEKQAAGKVKKGYKEAKVKAKKKAIKKDARNLFDLIKDGETDEFMQRVNSGENINIVSEFIEDPLISEVARSGNLDLFKCMIKNGAKLDNSVKKLMTCAAHGGNAKIVKILLDKGINTDFWSICYAAEKGNLDVVKLFLASGICDVNYQENIIVESMTDIKTRSDTFLAAAASRIISMTDDVSKDLINKKVGVIKYLLDNGAEINLRGRFGNTALHMSAGDNNLKIIEFLLKNGADKKTKNDNGQRAFEYCDRRHKKAKALLK